MKMKIRLKSSISPTSKINTSKPRPPAYKKIGNVLFFDGHKGFGFIQSGQKRVFFHDSGIADNRDPQPGDRVVFDIGRNAKGPCAVNIQVKD